MDSRLIQPLDHTISAVVRPPGSKSFTNRALVVAALASGGVSRLEAPLEADDTSAMRAGLAALGVNIDDADDPWLVLGSGGALRAPAGPIDARASGTTARFLTAAAVLADGPVTIDGTERMRQRPIAELADALTRLGAKVKTRQGCLPVTVTGGGLAGGEVAIDGGRSSQFVSALLMVAPMAEAEVWVRPTALVSIPYIESTREVMTAFGAQVDDHDGGYLVSPTGYTKCHYTIEADASAAAYPLAAAAITGGTVAVAGIPAGSTQADLRLVEVLEQMGCRVQREEMRIVLSGPGDGLQAVEVDMNQAPDASLALAVVCLFADGPSRIRNIGNLRLKETDRLAALEIELNRVGGAARVEGDDLLITPGRLHPARVETYDDHRMAMSFALVGLVSPGIEILDPGCVAKTWPAFFEMLDKL